MKKHINFNEIHIESIKWVDESVSEKEIKWEWDKENKKQKKLACHQYSCKAQLSKENVQKIIYMSTMYSGFVLICNAYS